MRFIIKILGRAKINLNLFERFSTAHQDNYQNTFSEINSSVNRLTSFKQFKNFLGSKFAAPSYISKTKKRECVLPEYIRSKSLNSALILRNK